MKSVTQSQLVKADNSNDSTVQIHGLSSCTEQATQKIGDSPLVQVNVQIFINFGLFIW